ncbi:Uncharacterised protein [Bordetella pertussis]|nr:Uncharacterised protein [Bordetella pertussis]CFU85023.1 Uncharacterised protein [Bordetella pertussis]CPI24163.1 Uncharacterised protein [Bordetella pertussis]CPL25140.1 Uncharacterised protein [Bordetella pertussis]CPM24511.1 Uncharacterised protein [Bordetella pertussis]
MCVASPCTSCSSNSLTRCGELPGPAEPYELSLPVFSRPTSSPRVLMDVPEPTATTRGVSAISDTTVKSFNVS